MHKIFNTHFNRVKIINLLYQYQFYQGNEDFLQRVDVEVDENSMKIYQEVINNLLEVDDMIDNNLYNYSLNRLNLVDLSIVRLCTYELMYTDMPNEISINEAINLTKELSDLDDGRQHKFTNKLLDNIRKAK